MNWIINFVFVLSFAGHLGTDAKGTMLKCGEDIVVGRGAKKNLRFWSSEDELMKVEIFPELPPKKANDASALLSIFKNVPSKIIDTTRGTQPASEIIKKVKFPPAYRTSDLETQNVAAKPESESSQNSDLNPSLMTQNNDDLFHPDSRDEITDSIRNRLNQIKLRPNESSIVEDTLAEIRDRITTFKEEIELTTMPNEEVAFGIQPVTEEQNFKESQPEAAPADLFQKVEKEQIENVKEGLNDQTEKLEEVPSNLDTPTNNVAVIRNQIIELMENYEKTNHDVENTDNSSLLKLSKSETNVDQIKTIEKIRSQISKLKESGENLENLEEIIAGVKKQILNLKESIIPVTNKEKVKTEPSKVHMASDFTTDIQENEAATMGSNNTDKQETLTVDDPIITDQVELDSDISKSEIRKPEIASISSDTLDQKETKKSENLNLSQADKDHEVNAEEVDDSNFDVGRNKTTSDVDAETAAKTTTMGVGEEPVIIPIAVKNNLGNEDEIGIDYSNDEKVKPQEYPEQGDDVAANDGSDLATENAVISSHLENSDVDGNKNKIKKPNENQFNAGNSDVLSHTEINVEQTLIQKEDPVSFDHIQEDRNDINTKPISETVKESLSQVLKTSIDDSSHQVSKDKGDTENEAITNEPKKSLISSETQTENLDQIDKHEESLKNSNHDSVDNIEAPKQDNDFLAGSKSANEKEAGTKLVTEEDLNMKSVAEEGSSTKLETEKDSGIKSNTVETEKDSDIKSDTEEGTSTKLETDKDSGLKLDTVEAGTKLATEEESGIKSNTEETEKDSDIKSAIDEGTSTKLETDKDSGLKLDTVEAGTKLATEKDSGIKSNTEETEKDSGIKSNTEETEKDLDIKSATEEGTSTNLETDNDSVIKLDTVEAGAKLATEEESGIKSNTEETEKDSDIKSATEEGTSTNLETDNDSVIKLDTVEAGTKLSTEKNSGINSANVEGTSTKLGTKKDSTIKSVTEETEEDLGIKTGTEEETSIKLAIKEDLGIKSVTEETEKDSDIKSATEKETSTKLATEKETNIKELNEVSTANQSEISLNSGEKSGNEKNYQNNTFNLETSKINSYNVGSELTSKVQDFISNTKSDSGMNDSEKDHPRKEEKITDENLKAPEHEHIAISIPKKILDSITSVEKTDIISDNQPAANDNTKVSNENSDIQANDSENDNNTPDKISYENVHSTEGEKTDVNVSDSFEKIPILPEIIDTLKKIEAEKPKHVEKTIPKIILDSLHKDSSTHIINDAAVAQPMNINSDTKVPTQSNFENQENIGASHLPEAEEETTKLEEESLGSVDNLLKLDTQTTLKTNNEDLSLNKAETANDSQVTDKVMNFVNPILEDENLAMTGDTSVVTSENKDQIQQKIHLESQSHHLDTTDNHNSTSTSDGIENRDESVLQIDEIHEDEVQLETEKIPEQNAEIDFQTFDDEMQASKIRIDDESDDLYKKPLIEMDYDGVIKYNEELENRHTQVNAVYNSKKKADLAEAAQQTPETQHVSHNLDENLAVDINNQHSNQKEKDDDEQHFSENQKIKIESNADIVRSEPEKDAQNQPTMSIKNEPMDINFEPNFSNQYETDIDKLEEYYDDFHDTNKETVQTDDKVLKVNNLFKYPENFSADKNSNQPLQTDSSSTKTQSDKANDGLTGMKNNEVEISQEHSQLSNQDKDESGNSFIINQEKLKASEIQAGIVRLIEKTLNSAQNSADSNQANENKNILPSTEDLSPIEFDTENLKVINPENKKHITTAEESSDLDNTKDATAEIPNFPSSNEASIRKEEIANEKLSEILTKLNEKRVTAENDKVVKPIEIYPEDIGYDETQKEYINANINILKSIVNQVATDLAVNKKEAESKIESNLKPINLIYKPDYENIGNENIGIIDYYSDPDSIPQFNEDDIPVEYKEQPVILAQTEDSLKESLTVETEDDTNQKNVQTFIGSVTDESPNLASEIRPTQNDEIKMDENPTGQILISRDRINSLINSHKAEIKLQQDAKIKNDPAIITKETLKEDALTAEQNEEATNDEPANSKSDKDVIEKNTDKKGEISIPFGFLNWFGKESSTKNKAPTVSIDEKEKITTWSAITSESDQNEDTTKFVFENDILKRDENDNHVNTTDVTTTESSAVNETENLNIMKENSVFSKETGSDNILSLMRDSVVKQKADQVQEETHSEIPIPFIFTNLQENVTPEDPAFTKPVIIKEHDSKVVFFTPDTNSVENKPKKDKNIQENVFNQAVDYALETTTESMNNSEANETIIFMNEEFPLLESVQINNDQTENTEEKSLLDEVAGKELQKIKNDDNISPESKMNSQENEPQIEIATDSTIVRDEEPEIIHEEFLHSDQIKETTNETLKSGALIKNPVVRSDEGQTDEIDSQAEPTNEKDDESNFLSILEKYVIDDSPVNSYIPEKIYHKQGTEVDQENYNININNHNYQSIPINRFSFNNNDYENVRRRIDENMQDNIQYEKRRHDNNPPSDIYQSGSPGPSLSSLLQTRKGFIGPAVDEGHISQGSAQLRRVDSSHTVGGDSPFFIKLPGSPNAVPVFLQYEPVQVKYVDPEKLKKKNPSLKNEHPILPLFKKNVTSNNQRSNIKTTNTNTENKSNLNAVNSKLEDEGTNEIKSKPDPFFIMEAPDLGKDKGITDSSIFDKPESSPLITDDSLSVNLKGHLNFNLKDTIPSTIIGSKPLYPGEYVIKNPDSSYSSSDTQTLSNRVFDLGAKGTIPNSVHENPQYTPFPLTTNPPRTESMSAETIATSSTSQATELREENISNKTESVDYVTIPSINFNESFDGIAYPDLPLTERLRDDYGFFESDTENVHEKEDNDEKIEDQLVQEVGLFATPKTGIPPKEEEFDIVALANFLHQNQKVWSNNNMAPMSEDDGSWRGPVWNNLKYSNVNGEDSWPQPLGDSPWLTNEEGQANARDYSAFYSPEEIPGLDPLYFSYRQMPTTSREPRTPETEVENIKTFIDKLPIPLKAAVVGDSAPNQRSKRAASIGEQIYCEWNFKTEPGLYLLVTFTNLSAPFTVDCYGAYIEVERESNGYGARWCGHRASLTESRQHVIFAKHQVRVSVYDNGDLTKNQVTGFEAEIEAIDLFDSEDYDSFMRSKASSKIRRLMEG